MALLRNARIEDDDWIFVADDQDIPATGPVVISLARYSAERDALDGRTAPLGLILSSDETPRAIAGDVSRFGLICLHFSKFTDGRCYSGARLVRERYGFQGELRAIGIDAWRDGASLRAPRHGIDHSRPRRDARAGSTFSAFCGTHLQRVLVLPGDDGHSRDDGGLPGQ